VKTAMEKRSEEEGGGAEQRRDRGDHEQAAGERENKAKAKALVGAFENVMDSPLS
jgi:hypothetical protein